MKHVGNYLKKKEKQQTNEHMNKIVKISEVKFQNWYLSDEKIIFQRNEFNALKVMLEKRIVQTAFIYNKTLQ